MTNKQQEILGWALSLTICSIIFVWSLLVATN